MALSAQGGRVFKSHWEHLIVAVHEPKAATLSMAYRSAELWFHIPRSAEFFHYVKINDNYRVNLPKLGAQNSVFCGEN